MSIPQARQLLIDCAKRQLAMMRELLATHGDHEDGQIKTEIGLLTEALGAMGQLDQNVSADQLPIARTAIDMEKFREKLPRDPDLLVSTLEILIDVTRCYCVDMRDFARVAAQHPQLTAQEALLAWVGELERRINDDYELCVRALRTMDPSLITRTHH